MYNVNEKCKMKCDDKSFCGKSTILHEYVCLCKDGFSGDQVQEIGYIDVSFKRRVNPKKESEKSQFYSNLNLIYDSKYLK